MEPLALNVGNEKHIEKSLEDAASIYGKLDILVNNVVADKTVTAEELAMDDWNRILAINLQGPFLLSRFALPMMKERGGGHIVNIMSTAAERACPNAAAYHASK